MWEIKERALMENSRNHNKHSLDKIPFDRKYWHSILWRKILQKDWEKLALRSPKILAQNNDKTPFYRSQKNLTVGLCQCFRSTGPVDRQRSKSDRCSLRSTGSVDRPGRPILQCTLACTLCTSGRPTRSTGYCQFWKIRTARTWNFGIEDRSYWLK